MTNRMYTGEETVGALVAAFPGAANVFKKHAIDFCCGGNRALNTVIRQQGLDKETVLGELNEAWTAAGERIDGTDWRAAPSRAIIAEIVTKHHDYLRSELPLLADFTAKILRVHGPHHADSLEPLYRYFQEFKRELETHMVKEEQELFPLILAHEENPTDELYHQAESKLEELEREHEHAGDLLKRMREVTGGYTLPEGACRTYQLTFTKLEELESDMFRHIHLENNILFLRYTGHCGCHD
ncbi:iron-sulfur cluster repair di-iron protein [Gorillibacterium sp. sgz5001074]|uniref:iron-sulfur cluster repair di-iron protein n=1 Tax=Gorillibacterium sp. sgz5001074 TaxID=3446695 RepID=UPI003F678A5B